MKIENYCLEHNGKYYYHFLEDFNRRLTLNGKIVEVGTMIISLWIDCDIPTEANDIVKFGPIGDAGRFGYYLEKNNPRFKYASVFCPDLWVRLPD